MKAFIFIKLDMPLNQNIKKLCAYSKTDIKIPKSKEIKSTCYSSLLIFWCVSIRIFLTYKYTKIINEIEF